ncbi:MAG: methyltransferase [Bacteroidales bacterium]|nr:methyltransferase [Bacteroidales bacterium]MBQ9186106.1 methyltransferase [Bacteroidales bacterium]
MFTFKQFSVQNDGAAFKVGTDAVLLGSAASLVGNEVRILDAGTGTGIIALMLAQRLSAISADADFYIDGIDADAASADEATLNFGGSPWAKHLNARHLSLEELAKSSPEAYDLVISNPPYFENSLLNPDQKRRTARHAFEDSLSWRSLMDFSVKYLAASGRLIMILPSDIAGKAIAAASAPESPLSISRILNIKTNSGKPATRAIIEMCRTAASDRKTEVRELVIQEGGEYTPAYKALTKDFHPFL